ncbi:MAG: H-NS family nucleoid-associated regulatory protein [Aquabacterium sp.]|nr:H-NS family nucleoid-associated regulatory protein [Aquabacterium sp.]
MKTPEQEAVLRSVRKLMAFWQITEDELGYIPAPVVIDLPKRPPPTTKYRHPRTYVTWNGEGPQPPWLREALTREGYTVDELRLPSTEDAAS